MTWDYAWNACMGIGSGTKLLMIETASEFQFLYWYFSNNYPTNVGWYVDAQRLRYGCSISVAAWGDGRSLYAGNGTLFNGIVCYADFVWTVNYTF